MGAARWQTSFLRTGPTWPPGTTNRKPLCSWLPTTRSWMRWSCFSPVAPTQILLTSTASPLCTTRASGAASRWSSPCWLPRPILCCGPRRGNPPSTSPSTKAPLTSLQPSTRQQHGRHRPRPQCFPPQQKYCLHLQRQHRQRLGPQHRKAILYPVRWAPHWSRCWWALRWGSALRPSCLRLWAGDGPTDPLHAPPGRVPEVRSPTLAPPFRARWCRLDPSQRRLEPHRN
mmetsp:Transcript_31538/g.56625  ORF Transcript_31538/g.56625 Transcript_31538/m.56625 type:complete len:229 (+) Transcript_31538:262-948(+)